MSTSLAKMSRSFSLASKDGAALASLAAAPAGVEGEGEGQSTARTRVAKPLPRMDSTLKSYNPSVTRDAPTGQKL